MNLPQDVNPNQKPTAAEAVVASELRYRRLFESAKDGILILDAETGMVVDVNPFLSELLGFSHANLVGKKVWELGFLKDIIASEAHFAELQAKEYIRCGVCQQCLFGEPPQSATSATLPRASRRRWH